MADPEPVEPSQAVEPGKIAEPDRAIDRFFLLSSRLFRATGIFLVAIFGMELVSSLMELKLRNPTLEIRFISKMTDQIPVLLLGMTLLFCHPRRLRLKAEAWFLSWLSYGALIAMAAYLLSIPITTNAAIQIFRSSAFQVSERIKVQLERAKKVREATLALTPEQQQGMVARYNRANPKKKPIDVAEFLHLLDEELKVQEAKLEQERRSLLDTQQRTLYVRQLFETGKSLLGAIGFFLVWKYSGWVRTPQKTRSHRESETHRRWRY